ncbi:ribosomal RNA small subunit methyltransferase A [Candidatus Berkelbacteria bacterium]|nr:ribosomal RNA small subunit methyltransferase A [Candidatus Berkelbacteria bacterium]
MNFHPKKSLGQNFLKDERLLEPIIEAAELSPDDTVLEIGPGFGILTGQLAKQVGLVLAVEKDFQLVETLRKKFKPFPNIKIIHADILRFDLSEAPQPYKVVANLPFNITSPVVRKIMVGPRPAIAVLMVQKEVARRLTAPPGSKERGIVTVFLERYSVTRMVTTIGKGQFSPVPKFDAGVIKIVFNDTGQDKVFEQVVKAGFSSKRRQIHNSLAGSLRLPSDQISAILKQANVEPQKRAEDLTLRDWQALSQEIAHVFA